MKVGMVAEATCISKPWTIIPMVVNPRRNIEGESPHLWREIQSSEHRSFKSCRRRRKRTPSGGKNNPKKARDSLSKKTSQGLRDNFLDALQPKFEVASASLI
jgi:hypothetical protein